MVWKTWGMDEHSEISYLRGRIDELWDAVHTKGNPTANAVAGLQGWKPAVDETLRKLDQRLFDLALIGAGKRLDLLEAQIERLNTVLTQKALGPENGARPETQTTAET